MAQCTGVMKSKRLENGASVCGMTAVPHAARFSQQGHLSDGHRWVLAVPFSPCGAHMLKNQKREGRACSTKTATSSLSARTWLFWNAGMLNVSPPLWKMFLHFRPSTCACQSVITERCKGPFQRDQDEVFTTLRSCFS